jgi:hypothetical protein
MRSIYVDSRLESTAVDRPRVLQSGVALTLKKPPDTHAPRPILVRAMVATVELLLYAEVVAARPSTDTVWTLAATARSVSGRYWGTVIVAGVP